MATQRRRMDAQSANGREAKGHHAIALGWLKRGRFHQAITSLEKALAINPNYLEAHLELARVLLHMRRWQDLAAHCRAGFRSFLEIPELHKFLITALEEQGSLEDAYACYGLERRDSRCLSMAPEDILCCLVARNERPRLPYFLDYYRRLGVDRFLVVDNGSNDGSTEWLLGQPDVHVWSSDLSFKRANFGSSWFELLLRRYGIGHWCLTLDADEFLLFEGAPHRSLKQFCHDLDRRGKKVATGILLDLYSDRPVQQTLYREGDDPLQLCRFFDGDLPATVYRQGGPYRNQDIFFGGVRQRVFPAQHDYLLSKSVLLRYQPDVVINPGQHLTNIKAQYHAREEICLLHFKFFASFEAYARQEAERKVHAMGAEQYQAYAHRLNLGPSLVLYDPALSVAFESTAQLRQLGFLREEERPPMPCIPVISPLPASITKRPFWSVMVSIYDRLQNVERVLTSVLRQADEAMQIEVVCDHCGADLQAAIGAEVLRVGGGRVGFHPLPERLGHPDVLNHCIELAHGRWVHVLHDDDWVEPGFYAAMRRGLEDTSEAGAAFCQHSIVTSGGVAPGLWHSWAERETAGIIDGWLERIILECRVQFSAMVVRRDIYEKLGGFSADALSAFDWEMWIRIAAHYPVFHLPELLVGVGRDERAETSRLIRNGEQIRDAFVALDMVARLLPSERMDRMVTRGRERLAAYALEQATRCLKQGDVAAAMANLQAAATGRPSLLTMRRVIEFLQGEHHDFKG